MFSYAWPIGLVVFSNIMYQICAKSVPQRLDPFASLTVTYLVGAAVSAVLYWVIGSGGNIIKEYGRLSWSPFVFGFVLVGLEVGWIFAYKAGWQVSTASVVQSSFLSAFLLIVGFLFYHEAITWNKLLGVVICMIGLVFINIK